MVAELLTALDDIVAAHGERAAVEGPDGHAVTFRALLDAARTRAEALQAAGLRAGDRMVVCRARSVALVVELLAAWRVGAAPVLLDPAGPPARRAEIERRARPRLISRDEGLVAPDGAVEHDPGVAYVIFTSGSSGAPKGVRVGPAGLLPLLRAQIEAFAIGPGARSLAWLSPGFDAFLSDLGCALLSGATLVMPRDAERDGVEATRAAVERRRITHLDYPPSLLRWIAPEAWPACLELLVIGGEACSPEVLAAHAARRRVVNVYGPTEATICTSLGVVDPATWRAPRIGEPLAHVRYRVSDEGELWIAGPALALGYLDAPDEDARAFVEHEGRRWYRTGDRVRTAGGPGGLVFEGRLDRQLKLGGVRVELGEIERRIEALPGVTAAAVVRAEGGALAAYVEGSGWREEDLRAALIEQLPDVAVPRWIVPAGASLPRTTSGKLERERAAGQALWAVLEEALGRAPDPARTFRDNGGDSLAALHVAAVARTMGVPMEPTALYRAPSLEALIASTTAASGPRLGFHRADALRLTDLPARPPVVARDGATLIVGAAGYLGAHVLRTALARDHRATPLIALVRAPDDDDARARLAAALGHALPTHLRVASRAEALADTPLVRVLDCAGQVSLLDDDVAEANRAPVRTALALAARWGARVVLAGSLAPFVVQAAPAGVVEEDARIADHAELAGAYAAAKWAGEQAVRAAAAEAVVVRLGLLVGDRADDQPHPRCQLSSFARGLAAIGCAPAIAEDLRVDLTPVELAAAALLDLGLDAPAGTYHVASETGLRYTALMEAVARHRPLEPCAVDAFERRAREASARAPHAALALTGLRRRAHGDLSAHAIASDLFLTTGARFDRAHARAALGEARLPRSDDGALVDRLIARALGGGAP